MDVRTLKFDIPRTVLARLYVHLNKLTADGIINSDGILILNHVRIPAGAGRIENYSRTRADTVSGRNIAVFILII